MTMRGKMTIIVWFRKDLRIEDNPALWEAFSRHQPILPLYIWSPEDEKDWSLGAASQWWLHHSLESLHKDLKSIGLDLIIRKGKGLEVLNQVIQETKANSIYWNRRYEPSIISRDSKIKSSLTDQGIDVQSFNSSLLYEPWTIANKQNKPFQVFTPFWKTCLSHGTPNKPLGVPSKTPHKAPSTSTLKINDLQLLPTIPWDKGIKASWTPGTEAAKTHLKSFNQKIQNYLNDRDHPDTQGTSLLSPYLHFGEVSPRMVWHLLKDVEGYQRQLGWREFAYHLLYHFPKTPSTPLRSDFQKFRWLHNPSHLSAWQKGLTGYPIVDAGMRELWATGWMHNRVRMIVGSFLVKDLLLPWQEGAKWFWDTLVDADLANNTLGWQWVGGCGADAAPYFRIFNPITQGNKFDPEGNYVRQWIPEIAKLSNKWIHQPWKADPLELKMANITLGKTYPHPLVDHAEARKKALEHFQHLRENALS